MKVVLPVAFLDLILSGIRLDVEDIVELSFLGHGCEAKSKPRKSRCLCGGGVGEGECVEKQKVGETAAK